MTKPRQFQDPCRPLALSLAMACLGQFFLAQPGWGLDLVLGALLDLGAVLYFIQSRSPSKFENQTLSPSAEIILFLLFLTESLLFRLVKLDQIPAGLNGDTASDGWGALRILYEGWHPLFKDFHTQFIFPAPFYELSLWFHFFPATQYSLLLSGVALWLISLPFIYWFFRQLAGAPAALLTLAFFAPMRWDVALCRMAHPGADIHIFIFGALAFFLYALESGKKWAWFVSSAFLAAGFYGYDAFKPTLPLIAVLLIYEFFKNRARWVQEVRALEGAFLLFLVLSAPMWISLMNSRAFGNPHDHLSIFETYGQKGFWTTLLENPIRTALMFNHQGDDWPAFNPPGHRLLDDATAIFAVLGFGLALARWKERPFFYALAGLLWLCLPAPLTADPTHTARTFGAAPFTAFLAALALWEVLKVLSSSKTRVLRAGRWVLLPVVFLTAAYENGKIYFVDMAGSPDFNWASALQQTAIGKAIQADPGNNDYYVEPHFFPNFLLPPGDKSAYYQSANISPNYTVLYLSYFKKGLLRPLSWPETPLPNGRGAWFILDRGQSGILQCLRDWYPVGALSAFEDKDGVDEIYFYKVPASGLKSGFTKAKLQKARGRGLLGTYESPAQKLQRLEPVLNFAYQEDFPILCLIPTRIQWTGDLRIRRAGIYQFLILSADGAKLKLAGKELLNTSGAESAPVTLKPGLYPLDARMEKEKGFFALFHLLWKPPGMDHFEIIPARALQASPPAYHLGLKKGAETTPGE